MHPHEQIALVRDVTVDEREVLFVVEHRLKDERLEVTVLGRQGRLGDAAHQLLVVAAVADEIGDGDERQTVALREGFQFGQPGHIGLVGRHDLTEHPRRVLTREAAQVDGRFGVTGAFEDAARSVAQGKDVARSVEVRGTRRGVDQGAHRRRAVTRGDAGRGAVAIVDGHREGGSLRLGVGEHHQGQVELVGAT